MNCYTRLLLRTLFPATVGLAFFGADAFAQATSPAASSNTGAQPGLSSNQGSNSQTQQPGSSQTGTQSGAVNPSGTQSTAGSQSAGTGATSQPSNSGTGNSGTSGSGNSPAAGGVTIPRPAEGVRDAGGAGSSATSPAAGSPATGSPVAAGQSISMASNDQQLAQFLIIDNEGEIAVSQLGVQRAQNPMVKEFAERMVKEHEQMLGKLRPLTAEASGRNATRPDSNVLPQSTTIPSSTPAETGRTDAVSASLGGISGGGAQPASGTTASGGLDFVGIKRELGAQCLASKQAELQEKQGAEFDKTFMGIQTAMHMDAVDTLKVFQKHATGELRKTIDEALPITQAHLEHAKTTMKSLQAGNAAATPNAP